ncbi:hypothetical protein EhV18_00008 [Emiliania huxleyi virus 18]|nr:hypothetical protein EhV18_00008 [Emiliania huxleyi virus 18]
MSDLDMYNTYVSRDVIEPLYKNSYRGYIPAFNQFVNNIDNLTMADIEQGNALRIHARHISVLYSNIATLRAEKSDEIATLRTEKMMRLRRYVQKKMPRLRRYVQKNMPRLRRYVQKKMPRLRRYVQKKMPRLPLSMSRLPI